MALELNQFKRSISVPNYAVTKENDNTTAATLYNFQINYVRNLWKYKYSTIGAFFGDYTKTSAMGSYTNFVATPGSATLGIGAKYVLKFSDAGGLSAGYITAHQGRRPKITDTSFQITGLIKDQLFRDGLDAIIATQGELDMAIQNGEASFFEYATSAGKMVADFWNNVSEKRDTGFTEQILAEAKDISTDFTITKAELVGKDPIAVAQNIAKILSKVKELARTKVPELGVGQRNISDYKVLVNDSLLSQIMAVTISAHNTLAATVFGVYDETISQEISNSIYNYKGLTFIGDPNLGVDDVVIATPAFSIAPVVPVRISQHLEENTGTIQYNICAAVPRVIKGSGDAGYVGLYDVSVTNAASDVETVKPLISFWNKDEEALKVRTDKGFDKIRDLALVKFTLE